ncbi:MAG: spore coat protein CotJB [Sporomusa sp.]
MDKNQVEQQNPDKHRMGSLPCTAPLAVPFVPFQENNPPMFDSTDALNSGTIFPGLDLPWMNKENSHSPLKGTLLFDLAALEFACDDIQLYLDTHEDDMEVFEMFKYYLAEAQACREEYIKKYGPLRRDDMLQSSEFDWLRGPWPWEYDGRMD